MQLLRNLPVSCVWKKKHMQLLPKAWRFSKSEAPVAFDSIKSSK